MKEAYAGDHPGISLSRLGETLVIDPCKPTTLPGPVQGSRIRLAA